MKLDTQVMEQKRVNEILSKAVDKHSFSEKAYRGEFERIKAEYDLLLNEKKSNLNNNLTPVVITPPDSSSEKSLKGYLNYYKNIFFFRSF